jgi:hypothetical protein
MDGAVDFSIGVLRSSGDYAGTFISGCALKANAGSVSASKCRGPTALKKIGWSDPDHTDDDPLRVTARQRQIVFRLFPGLIT